MSSPQSGPGNQWPPPGPGQTPPAGQPYPLGQPYPPGQLPPGQQPYGTYSAPYQPQPTGQDPQGAWADQTHQTWTPQPQQPFTPPSQPHDPGSPFQRVEHRSVSIQDFQQPHSRRPLWLGLLVLLAVGAILLAMFRFGGSSPSAPATPTPTPAPASPTTPAPVPSSMAPTRSVPFVNDNDHTAGTFEIVDYKWNGGALILSVKVTMDKGSQTLGFFALDNATTTDYDPDVVAGTLDGRQVTAGETVTGIVQFTKDQGTTTVFFTDSRGRQVAALKVSG